MSTPSSTTIVRVYDHDAAFPEAAYRVLVDRLWPRGVAKADLHYDAWPKNVTPSPELRKWYGHDPDRWKEFRRRYRAELATGDAADALREILDASDGRPLVLLTAVKAVEQSAAEVLVEVIGQGDPAH